MANEFGNTGALSTSSKRLSAKNLESSTSIEGAEYEAFYNGTWRDISSDYFYDTTKAGNEIARCIRWDDGFRSYRVDRGLIIRKKERDTDEQEEGLSEDIAPLETFGRAFRTSLGISVAIKGFDEIMKTSSAQNILSKFSSLSPSPSPVGRFISQNKVALFFTGLTLVRDTGQSTGEKLGQAAISLGIGLTLRRLGPAGFFIGPAITAVEGLLTGAEPAQLAAGIAGNIAGKQTGKALGGKIFGSQKVEPTYGKSKEALMQSKELKQTVVGQQNKAAAYSVRGTKTESVDLSLHSFPELQVRVAANVKRTARRLRQQNGEVF